MIKLLAGSSFEKTYLFENKNNNFVRKKIILNNKNNSTLLEEQYRWLKFAEKNDLKVPALINKKKTKSFFYYDMSFINDSKNLSKFLIKNPKSKILKKVLLNINKFYQKNMIISSKDKKLLPNLLKKKIVQSVNSLSRDYKEIIDSKKIIINGKICNGLLATVDNFASGNDSFSKMINNNFDQKSKTIIHGDLTFENILIKNNNFYFIDPYGGFLDYKSNNDILFKTNILFDIAKLCQSLIANYENWNEKDLINLKTSKNKSFIIKSLRDNYEEKFKFLEKTFSEYKVEEFNKILKIYLVVTLARIIRYKARQSKKLGLLSYLMATYWANEVNNEK
jgi:tRNA A-37 threonylcarbamoyl transferase component Bud32